MEMRDAAFTPKWQFVAGSVDRASHLPALYAAPPSHLRLAGLRDFRRCTLVIELGPHKGHW